MHMQACTYLYMCEYDIKIMNPSLTKIGSPQKTKWLSTFFEIQHGEQPVLCLVTGQQFSGRLSTVQLVACSSLIQSILHSILCQNFSSALIYPRVHAPPTPLGKITDGQPRLHCQQDRPQASGDFNRQQWWLSQTAENQQSISEKK